MKIHTYIQKLLFIYSTMIKLSMYDNAATILTKLINQM
jgi:hypothetical protein